MTGIITIEKLWIQVQSHAAILYMCLAPAEPKNGVENRHFNERVILHLSGLTLPTPATVVWKNIIFKGKRTLKAETEQKYVVDVIMEWI